jgi:signal transduction histidine kinase
MYRSCVIFILSISLSCTLLSAREGIPVPTKGILDLRSYQFNNQTVINLNGEWEFYWDRLLNPEEFTEDGKILPDLYGKIPSYWSSYKIDGKNLPGKGHATYRLMILLPEGFRRNLMFDVPVFDVAFKMYLNEFLVGRNGEPGISEEESQPGYSPFLTMLNVRSDTIHVLIQVSNYQHRRGGFWKTMRMGSTNKLVKLSNQYKLISNISLGVLICFALFFLFFFLLYRKEKITLYFSITLVGIFIRLISTDIFPVLLITESLPWNWLIRMEYLGTFMAFGFGMWYFYSIYPGKITRLLVRINSYILIVLSIIVVFFRVDIFAYSMLYVQPAAILFLTYFLIISTIKVINGKLAELAYLSGIIIFVAALINDILIANSQTALTRNYSIHFAVQLFVFIHAVMIIRNWIFTYTEKERLHREINFINRNLEQMVSDRTAELNERNKELQDALAFKDRVFSIIAHDLKSPVASLVQNAELLNMDISDDVRRKVLASFLDLTHMASNLIDNLLYWGRSQGNQINYNPVDCDLDAIVNQVLQLFKDYTEQKSISIDLQAGEDTIAHCDEALLRIILRNLISNALKFTEKGGKVSILIHRIKDPEEIIGLVVKDNGIGIAEDKIRTLFTDDKLITTAGTEGERGTGLGLKLCHDLIKINKGSISIESVPGKGTNVMITLPAV